MCVCVEGKRLEGGGLLYLIHDTQLIEGATSTSSLSQPRPLQRGVGEIRATTQHRTHLICVMSPAVLLVCMSLSLSLCSSFVGCLLLSLPSHGYHTCIHIVYIYLYIYMCVYMYISPYERQREKASVVYTE